MANETPDTRKVTVASLNEKGEITEASETLEPKAEEAQAQPGAEAEKPPPEPAKSAEAEEAKKEAEAKAAQAAEEEKAAAKAEAEAAAEVEEEGKPAEGEKKKGKGIYQLQRRLDKATGEKYRALAERDLLREQLAEARKPSEPEAAGEADKKPKLEDFETTEEFVEKLAEWKADQRYEEHRKEEADRAQQEEVQVVYEAHNKRMAKAREKYEDFDEVTDIRTHNAVGLFIIELDNGPDVAYHLGQHPELCKELLSVSPLQAVAEVGRLSTSLAADTEQGSAKTPEDPARGSNKKPAASSAPAPIVPIGGGATRTKVPLDDENVDFEQFRDRRDAGEV